MTEGFLFDLQHLISLSLWLNRFGFLFRPRHCFILQVLNLRHNAVLQAVI